MPASERSSANFLPIFSRRTVESLLFLSYRVEPFSQPKALVLSVCARNLMPSSSTNPSWRMDIQVVMRTARNSRTLMWINFTQALGMMYCQLSPVQLKPPSANSLASCLVNQRGRVYVMWLILLPRSESFARNFFHKRRSR